VKKVVWLGSSSKRIRDFPAQAQHIAGKQLRQVQRGELPLDWRPMPIVGPGSIEIRVHQPQEYRVIYVASYPDAIYVLHCFAKKSQSTPLNDLKNSEGQPW
jgi:phage-related protein